jgi:hypothetical protein
VETSLVETTSRKISGQWYLFFWVAHWGDLSAARRSLRRVARSERKSASLPVTHMISSRILKVDGIWVTFGE